MLRRCWRIFAGLCLTLAFGQAARAEPTAADKAVAEQLFQEARQLFKAGSTREACAKFTESQRVAPKLGTLLNLAACHERLGMTASAWAEFTEVAAQARKAQEDERERYARGHVRDLEARLTRIVLDAQAVDGATVRLDGKVLGAAALGSPIPVDPGEHSVDASAPGRRAWSSVLRVDAGPATIHVRVPALEPDRAAGGERPAPSHDAGTAPNHDRGRGQRILGVGLLGGGAIGLGIGAAFGVLSLSEKSDRDQHCNGTVCDQTGVDLHQSAIRSATASTVAFVAGAALIVGGLVVVLTAPSSSAKVSARQWQQRNPTSGVW